MEVGLSGHAIDHQLAYSVPTVQILVESGEWKVVSDHMEVFVNMRQV